MHARSTLPWRWYVDPDVLRLEQERIFRRTWQYVGHVGELDAQRPSYFASRAGEIPVLVTRAADGVLRAFLNVCRHRGAQLVDGDGSRDTVQCPYHAWTYGLRGELRAAPRAEREAKFDPADISLLPLAVDTWGPFVFVNPHADAAPLAATLGDLPQLVADAGVDVDTLAFHHRAESTVHANWKVCCENYLECYHCAVAHPGFSAVMDVAPDAYVLEQTAPTFSTQYAPVRESPAAATFRPGDGEVTRGQFHFLWPNLTINVMPGRANLSLGPVLPDGPERTTRFLDYFFAADADPEWVDELLAWDDSVGREDALLVERVQAGVRSGLLEHGTLLPESERLVAHFDTLVERELA